jgi:hypothetical protein
MLRTLRVAVPAGVALLTLAIPAVASSPVTVPAKDATQRGLTPPTLISTPQRVRVTENAQYPNTPVRFKVLPVLPGGYTPPASCLGHPFTTAARRTGSNGRVAIVLNPTRRFCASIHYDAEALIGSGRVPDKWAHFCVRGRTSQGYACSDEPHR